MKMLIYCVACQVQDTCKGKSWRANFSYQGKTLVMDLDCPIVPGTCYEILLKGKYPDSHSPNIDCVGGILKLSTNCPMDMEAMSIADEAKYRKGMGEKGWENT